ncbi:MAG: cell division ATP-binding protein FtsE [Peptococcaceae bacterium]|nr:cell division ATP-binding protein FtsE [Peptococcaceae bacterium]
MLHMFNVTKIYPNNVRAVHDVTLRIRRGEFVFLVGPSGAGKSTLIKLIYREELPSYGQVYFNGRNTLRLKGREVLGLRRSIGLVFQDFRLLPQRTAFENVALALEVVGASGRQIKKLVPEALKRVGLGQKGYCYPSQLSGGEQQRVCLARAIVRNPLLIVADEPTGNLDPDTAWGLMELLEQFNREGTTVLIATHAWDIVNKMQKRVIALENGRVVRDEERGSYGHDL